LLYNLEVAVHLPGQSPGLSFTLDLQGPFHTSLLRVDEVKPLGRQLHLVLLSKRI
jgi:hypothetical protein